MEENTNENKEYIIQIKNLNVFYDKSHVLKDISIDIEKGDFLGIIGPNGGGKSTFLKAILNLIEIESGRIEILNKDKEKAFIGYVPQFGIMDRSFPISVFEVVMSGMINKSLNPFSRYTKEMKENAMEQLKKVNLEKMATRQILELSGGEFQRLLIARALAINPKILLLDEPTANVDTVSRNSIFTLLKELNEKGITVILVTHDLSAISSNVKTLACLNGNLIYHGKPELTKDTLNSLYGCPIDLIAHGISHRVLDSHKEGECKC